MSAKSDRIIRQLAGAIQNGGKPKTSPYDTTATVRRIENGVAWVHIPGGVDETPVRMTINAAPGDQVQVRVSGGRAFMVGNATAPPTDDKTAVRAVKAIEVTNKVVETVKRIADRASKIAGNTAQYFWHTETGTDTGAHITEIPQEQFEGDPENGGGNLLLRSNGLAVRDGLDELATFSATGSRIGAADGGYIETEVDRFRAASKLGDKYFEVRDLSGQEITLERTGTGATRNFYAPNADTSIAPSVTVDGVATSATWIGTAPDTMVQLPFPYPAAGSVILITYTIDSTTTVPCFTAGTRGADGYEGAYSAVLGKLCYASGEGASAAGIGTTAPGDGQMVVGKYNDPDGSDFFQVGNGTSDSSRSNAFAIGSSGEIKGITQTDTPTITRTSGGTTSNPHVAQFGKVVMLNFEVTYNTSVAAGGNVYEGNIATPYRPKYTAMGCSYYGSHALIAKINSSGDIVIRNASATAITLENAAIFSVTYILP